MIRISTSSVPGARDSVPLDGLWLYVVADGSPAEPPRVERLLTREGVVIYPENGRSWSPTTNAAVRLYCTHRPDLLELDVGRWFRLDGSGLPLLGPLRIGEDLHSETGLDIWAQDDWLIVSSGDRVARRPAHARLAEWREDYSIGQLYHLKGGGLGFLPHGDQAIKDRQERLGPGKPMDLVRHGGGAGERGSAESTSEVWVGTLSASESPKLKVLFQDVGLGGVCGISSLNEIPAGEGNQMRTVHHSYDRARVEQLAALPASGLAESDVASLPEPPASCRLPGDIAWHDQKRTNNCGAFSFAAAMNYWFPEENNPLARDGAWYAQPGRVDHTVNGARTPADIARAAERFDMHGADRDCASLEEASAMRLLRSWIAAGVPCLVLVEESYDLWSLHWKVVVGYDEERIFIINSGADHEADRSERTPGVDYETAPVGNDVDAVAAFARKWSSTGGGVVDWFTSVDRCSFLPVWPKDLVFAADGVH